METKNLDIGFDNPNSNCKIPHIVKESNNAYIFEKDIEAKEFVDSIVKHPEVKFNGKNFKLDNFSI